VVTERGSSRDELARADECLRASRVLVDAGLHADAVGRSYFAIFHAGQALLASIGRSARSHDGVRHLVSEHFVKTGILDAGCGRLFARAAADRGDADYDVAAVFTSDLARQSIADAERFVAAVVAIVDARPPG
jgi:uncharacterized protein (UPF0332 family)